MEEKHKKFKFKTPHTYALLMFVIFLAWLLTYIIPAGEYAREKKGSNTCRFRDLPYCGIGKRQFPRNIQVNS